MVDKEFGLELWIVLAVYIGLLLVIVGYVSCRRCCFRKAGEKEEGGLVDHFLAGRDLGPVALGLSVCASMFSGYTVVGLPAEAYSHGFSAWRWVGCGTFVTLVYMAYAPRMQWLSRVRGHDSLCSYIKDRYGIAHQYRDPLHWLMVVVLLVPCFVYLCAQFDAFGNTMSTLSGGKVKPIVGAAGLAGLVAIYEILGGLRAVALTDVIQGAVLVVGSLFMLVFMDTIFGGLPAISKQLEVEDPSLVSVMDASQGLSWAEFWIGVGVQRALFPDYPQRAMAARSQTSLKMAVGILALSPFVVQVPLLFFGIVGRAKHPGLENPKEVFTLVVLDIIHSDGFGKVIGSLMMSACVAAIMSTADSVLIVVSQIVTLDIVRPFQEAARARRRQKPAAEAPGAVVGGGVGDGPGVGADATEHDPSRPSKVLVVASRVITILAAGLCIPIVESNFDLSFMLQFQSAIIAQTLPTVVLAFYWRGMHKGAAIAGLLVGVGSGVGLVVSKIPGGILLSLAGNFIVTITVACTFPRFAAPCSEKHAEALLHVFWRKPSDALPMKHWGGAAAKGVAPPPFAEPINTNWGFMALAAVLPWLALPLYRKAGEIDPYLSGSPLWAVCAVVILLMVHFLLCSIIAFNWQERKPLEAYLADLPGAVLGAGEPGSPHGGDVAGAGGESALAEAAADLFHVHGHGGGEHVSALRGELQELRTEMGKLGPAQSVLVREAVREEINALFA